MKKFTISENITGHQLDKLLKIVAQHSTMMSVARYCDMNYSYEKALTKIKDAVKKHRLEYEGNIDGFKDYLDKEHKTESEIDAYFENIYALNLESINAQIPLLIKEEKNLSDFEDFIKVDYSNDTPVTSGPKFEILYLTIGDVFHQMKSKLPSLFKFPYKINDKCYEDLAFYNEDRVIMAVCSHEKFAYFNLTDKEYNEIENLGICS